MKPNFKFTPQPKANTTSTLLSLMVLASGITSAAACRKEKETDRCISFPNGGDTWITYKNWCECPGGMTLFIKSEKPLTDREVDNACEVYSRNCL